MAPTLGGMKQLTASLLLLTIVVANVEGLHHVVDPPLLLDTGAVATTNLRTAYHFQPERNWMNDPNGPMFYRGYYHFFYQYNPYAASWGNITWGHAVSTDLISWTHLPVALRPDKWYDINGVWSGSATLLPNGRPVLAYTGSSEKNVQLQNLAFPTNASDPYLTNWTKSSHNPIAKTPPGAHFLDFRDPTTAWRGKDGFWRMIVGSRLDGEDVALVYKSHHFLHWAEVKRPLHSTRNRRGMWECPDFYPVSMTGRVALETGYGGSDCIYILKASYDDDFTDSYALGNYNEEQDLWSPMDNSVDVHNGRRYDYGKFYASKTFFDPRKQRRVLWGWVNESDSLADDILKGWASVQAIPRTVSLDLATKNQLVQWPVEEVEKLREGRFSRAEHILRAAETLSINGASGSQVDVEVTFRLNRTQWGPLGLGVLVSAHAEEETLLYFEQHFEGGVSAVNLVCDTSRSSTLPEVDKAIYKAPVPISDGQKQLTLRVLVDNSIVEIFAEGGKACITARVYPMLARGEHAALKIFNQGADSVTVARLDAWNMKAATVFHA